MSLSYGSFRNRLPLSFLPDTLILPDQWGDIAPTAGCAGDGALEGALRVRYAI